MEKLMETEIAATNGKYYRVILFGCEKERSSYPFYLEVQTDTSGLLGIYTDLDNGCYHLVNVITAVIKDMGLEYTKATKIYDWEARHEKA